MCTGPLASLPIHAAGIYHVPNGESVSDYVISSYTPTLNALLTSPPEFSGDFEMLVAIDEERLKHTTAELQKIKLRVPSKYLVSLGIPGAPAYMTEILSRLPTASIVHLACHGVQDPSNPLNSRLILKDTDG